MSLPDTKIELLVQGMPIIREGLVKVGTVQWLLYNYGRQLFKDVDFSECWPEGSTEKGGRCRTDPILLTLMLLLQWNDKASDPESERRARADLVWKAILRLDLMEDGPGEATVRRFRKALRESGLFRTLHKIFLCAVLKMDFAEPELAVLDSTPLFGRASVRDAYNLIADGIRQVIQAMWPKKPKKQEKWAESVNLSKYLDRNFKGQEKIDWSDPFAKESVLKQEFVDAWQLTELVQKKLPELSDLSVQATKAALDVLNMIISQNLVSPDGREVALLQGVPPDRIVSAVEPEMRAGHKSKSKYFNGYKGHIMTCGHGYIIANEVTAGNVHDAQPAPDLLNQANSNGFFPKEATGDKAYGTADCRRFFEDSNVHMWVAPANGKSGTLFSKLEFQIDLDNLCVTCPEEQTTEEFIWVADTSARQKEASTGSEKVRQFRFSKDICNACSSRDKCFKRKKKADFGRTIILNREEELFQQAKEDVKSDHWRELKSKRQIVEQRLGHSVRIGGRESRFFHPKGVAYQWSMSTLMANLSRFGGDLANAGDEGVARLTKVLNMELNT